MAIRTREQALQQLFAAQRQGAGNVYGGPPQAQQQAAPAPALGGGSKADRLAAATGTGSSSGGGGGGTDLMGAVTGGLGTVLGGAATALGFMGRGVVTGVEHTARALPEGAESALLATGPLGAAIKRIDEDKSREDERSVMDRLKDPSFGYGQVAESTGNSSLDRLQGFAGDVLLDPLTYVGGGAAKSAGVIGKAGRQSLALQARRLGMGDDVIESVAKYGAAYLDDATREALNVKKTGVYFGIGDGSFKIPGSGGVGRGAEKSFAQIRHNTISRVGANRGREELQTAIKVLSSGRTVDGVTPRVAAARVQFDQDLRSFGKTWADPKVRQAKQDLLKLDDGAAVQVTHALESGQNIANVPEVKALFDGIFADMINQGIPVGSLDNYVPHRWTREANQFLNGQDPRAAKLKEILTTNPTADPSAVQRRVIKKGSTLEIDGKVITFEKGTIEEINQKLSSEFSGVGVEKWLQDDIRLLADNYIREASTAMGLNQAWKNLSEHGDLVTALKGVSVEQIDQMANVQANEQLAKQLRKVATARKAEADVQARTASKMSGEVLKSLDDSMKVRVKDLVADHKSLKGELSDLNKVLDSQNADEATLGKAVAQVRGKIDSEVDAVVKQLDDVEAELQAAELEFAGVATPKERSKRWQALVSKRQSIEEEFGSLSEIQERVVELTETVSEMAGHARRLDGVADSPDEIAEMAMELVDTKVTRQLPMVTEETIESASVKSLQKEMDELIAAGDLDEAAVIAQHKALLGDIDGSIKALDEVLASSQSSLDDANRAAREAAETVRNMPNRVTKAESDLIGKSERLQDLARSWGEHAERAAVLPKHLRENLEAKHLARQAAIDKRASAAKVKMEALESTVTNPPARIGTQSKVGEYYEAAEEYYFALRASKLHAQIDYKADRLLVREHDQAIDQAADSALRAARVRKEIERVEETLLATSKNRAELNAWRAASAAADDAQISHGYLLANKRRLAGQHAVLSDVDPVRAAGDKNVRARLGLAERIRYAKKIDEHGKVVGTITGMADVTIDRQPAYWRTADEVREEIDVATRELAEMVDPADLPALPPAVDLQAIENAGFRGFGAAEISDIEADTVAGYFGAMSRTVRDTRNEWRTLQNQRKKMLEELGIDDVEVTVTLAGAEPVAIRSADAQLARSDKVAMMEDSIRGLPDAQQAQLWEMQDKIKDLKLQARSAEKSLRALLKDYGLVDEQADSIVRSLGYGDFNDVIRYIPDGAGTRKQFTGPEGISVTVSELADQAKEKYGTIGNAWRQRPDIITNPNMTWSRMRHTQLAALLDGKARKFVDGSKRHATLSPEVVQEAQRDVGKQLVAAMTPKSRQRLWTHARSSAQQQIQAPKIARRMKQDYIDQLGQELEPLVRIEQQVAADRATVIAARDRSFKELQANQQAADSAPGSMAGRDMFEGERATRDARVTAANESGEKAEERLVALEAVEKQLGTAQAEEMRTVDARRALTGLQVSNKEEADAFVKASTSRLRDLRKRIKDGKLGKDKTSQKVLEKQADELGLLLGEVEGEPGVAAAAQLYGAYLDAVDEVGSSREFLKGIDGLAKKAKNKEFKLKTKQVVVDGWAAIDQKVFPEGEDLAVNAELGRMLTSVTTELSKSDTLRYFDEATQFFKTYATATPGFHVRNFMGATFMNFSDDVTLANNVKGFKTWRAYAKSDDPAAWLSRQTQDVQDAFRATFGSGAGGSFDAAEIGSGVSKLTKRAQHNMFVRGSRTFGEDFVEGPVRLAMAMDTIAKGGDMDTALGRIARIHFDYSQVGKFDKQMKRIIPFWTFMSRNLPLQLEQMWRKPKAYSIYNNFVKNFDQSEGDSEFMPGYLEEMGAFVGIRNAGFLGGDDAVLAPDLQHVRLKQEVGQFFPNPARALASGNPLLRVPIELGTNHSFFYDGELNRDGIDPKFAAQYAAQSMLPTIGQAQRVTGSGKYEDRQKQSILNYLGVPVKQLNDEVREREQTRREYADS